MALNQILAKVPNSVLAAFAGIGFIFISSKVLSYAQLLLSLFVLPGKNVSFTLPCVPPGLEINTAQLRAYGGRGTWAVITGASDGIGKEYAMQLASKGYNLVLISRTESKLKTLASEIETKYSRPGTKTFKLVDPGVTIKTKILPMDFARNDDADYAKLRALVDGLDVGILVNNVGQSHSIPVPFVLTPKEEMRDIITINCIGTLRVTRIVAPGMVQRKRGLILTMGSFGGLLPTPLLATYSGSKAFLQQWSTALGGELAGTGVDVELVLSYLVTTAMSKIRKPSLFIPNPRNFVKAVLGKIGRSGGAQKVAYTSTPFWGHAIMQWWLENTVGLGGSLVVGQNKKFHEQIRKRALRKAERDAKKA